MKVMELLSPRWQEYELIDSGNFEKLERFGTYVTIRPEPQAIWNKSLTEAQWSSMATAIFRRDVKSDERGEWSLQSEMPSRWWVNYQCGAAKISMRLALTSFKHVGLFPEQGANWDFIYNTIDELKSADQRPQVLNLFAYTGGATLAAAAAGAEVTHVDSVKQVVSWARENAEQSHMEGIRWIVDDALKFVRREVKRGKIYNGIILDPPAYGRGPDGEKWVLEQNINELLAECAKLLAPKGAFLVFNLYSMGLSALIAKVAVNQLFGAPQSEQMGELYVDDRSKKSLPLGIYYRMRR